MPGDPLIAVKKRTRNRVRPYASGRQAQRPDQPIGVRSVETPSTQRNRKIAAPGKVRLDIARYIDEIRILLPWLS